jgi:predicted amino acid dehydrogenase
MCVHEIVHKTQEPRVPLSLFIKQVAKNHHEYPVTKSSKHQKWLLHPRPGINLSPSKKKSDFLSMAERLYHEQAVRSQTFFETLRNFLVTVLYAYFPLPLPKHNIDFVFLIHTRYVEDYSSVFPFLNGLKRWSKPLYIWIIQHFPPCIIDHFDAENGLRGLLVSTPLLPDSLMKSRKKTQKEIYRVRKVLKKYCAPNPRKIVLGLGGWWPMVSRKGQLFNEIFVKDDGYRITTGHTATVYSLVSTTMQLIEKSEIERHKINVAILGCGNIGSHCAEFLLDLGVQVTLIDVNQKKLRQLRKYFMHDYPNERIHTALFIPKRIKRVLDTCHLGICATSNVGSIITAQQIPKHFSFIDDSRPEAIPRFSLADKRYTLEGGLLNISGLRSRFNFGFGNDQNTLGCLSESYLLAWDSIDAQIVKETVGQIDPHNFKMFSSFCDLKGIAPGDYKMGDQVIAEERLVHAIQKRHIKIYR